MPVPEIKVANFALTGYGYLLVGHSCPYTVFTGNNKKSFRKFSQVSIISSRSTMSCKFSRADAPSLGKQDPGSR